MYAQLLLAQCVSTAFILAWQAAGSDLFKDPFLKTDINTLWNEIEKELAHIHVFPCKKAQISDLIASTDDAKKKRVLSLLIQ